MKKAILILLFVLILPIVSAADLVFKQGEEIQLNLPCIEPDESFCPAATNCYLTANYPNGTNALNNATMSYSTTYFNYNISTNIIPSLGVYQLYMQCSDGTNDGFNSFTLRITYTGKDEEYNFLPITLVSIGTIFFFLIMGIYNRNQTNKAKEEQRNFKIPLALEVSAFSIAFIEVVLMIGMLFVGESGATLINLLNINFWIVLILTFGLGMLTIISHMFDAFNWNIADKKEGKWESNKKW